MPGKAGHWIRPMQSCSSMTNPVNRAWAKQLAMQIADKARQVGRTGQQSHTGRVVRSVREQGRDFER